MTEQVRFDSQAVMTQRDPNLVISSLSQAYTREGMTVVINIVRLEDESQWSLEVVNEQGTSTVFDEHFDSDDAAYATFLDVVSEEGIRTFLSDDDDNVIPFPTRH